MSYLDWVEDNGIPTLGGKHEGIMRLLLPQTKGADHQWGKVIDHIDSPESEEYIEAALKKTRKAVAAEEGEINGRI